MQKKDWEKQFPTIYYFSRPISFYLTYLILFVTEEPTFIVWVGFIVGLVGCFSFLFISNLTIWLGIVLLIVFAILDAVDGNIARVTRKVTYYGKFLDGALGEVIEASYCFWLGLGVYLNPGDFYALNFLKTISEGRIFIVLLGIAAVLGRLFSNIFQGGYYTNLIRKQKTETSFEENLTGEFKSSSYRKNWWFLLFINFHTLTLQLLILALCAAFKAVDLFLFFFALYYLLRLLVMMVFYTYRAQKNLS